MEDFVAVIEDRENVVQAIAESPQDVRDYLTHGAERLLAEPRFIDALLGFVLYDGRGPLIQERLASVASGAQ